MGWAYKGYHPIEVFFHSTVGDMVRIVSQPVNGEMCAHFIPSHIDYEGQEWYLNTVQ